MSEEKRTEVVERPVATPVKKQFPLGGIIAISAVVAVITGVVGFASGVQFQKVASNNRAGSQSTGLNDQGGFGARGGMNMNGSFGEVTAISDASITVATRQRFNSSTNSSTSTTKTYTINSSTTVTVDGETAKAGDIKTGDEVMIEPSSSDSNIAASIRVGFGGPGQQQSSNSSSSDTTTRTN